MKIKTKKRKALKRKRNPSSKRYVVIVVVVVVLLLLLCVAVEKSGQKYKFYNTYWDKIIIGTFLVPPSIS